MCIRDSYDPEHLATPQAWERDRDLVWAWYAWRAALVRRVTPNAGHRALADWAQRPGRHLVIATQNVDDLHERAGSQVQAHVHGSLFAFRCERCAAPCPTDALTPVSYTHLYDADRWASLHLGADQDR